MNATTVDVKHDAKVNCYAAQNSKAVDERPERRVQRDLTTKEVKETASQSNRITFIVPD